MLLIRDSPQNKRPTQTESEGLEKNIPRKWTEKRPGQQYLHQTKIDFKTKFIKRNSKGHFRIQKGRIHKEDINIGNIHAPNIGAPQKIKKILEDFKNDIDSNTHIVGDFNTPLSTMDISSKQRIYKDIVALNNTLDKMDLTYTHTDTHTRTLSSQRSKIHILFKCTWNIFKDR